MKTLKQVEILKYISNIIILLLIVLVTYGIVEHLKTTKEIKEAKETYDKAKETNDVEQEQSKEKIAVLRIEIDELNTELRLLRGKKSLVRVETKWRTKWKTKYVDKVEYVTLPVKTFTLQIKEIKVLEQLVSKWKLTAEEWQKRYNFEVIAHESCQDYVIVLEKTKRTPKWVYVALTILATLVIIK